MKDNLLLQLHHRERLSIFFLIDSNTLTYAMWFCFRMIYLHIAEKQLVICAKFAAYVERLVCAAAAASEYVKAQEN
jgi:hypothetical protein